VRIRRLARLVGVVLATSWSVPHPATAKGNVSLVRARVTGLATAAPRARTIVTTAIEPATGLVIEASGPSTRRNYRFVAYPGPFVVVVQVSDPRQERAVEVVSPPFVADPPPNRFDRMIVTLRVPSLRSAASATAVSPAGTAATAVDGDPIVDMGDLPVRYASGAIIDGSGWAFDAAQEHAADCSRRFMNGRLAVRVHAAHQALVTGGRLDATRVAALELPAPHRRIEGAIDVGHDGQASGRLAVVDAATGATLAEVTGSGQPTALAESLGRALGPLVCAALDDLPVRE